MNVLLVSFSFPPAGGVGVLRALSLAKYLPTNGISVDVLTARNAPAVVRDEGLLAQVPSSVRVHRTWTLDLPFALRKGVKKLLTRDSVGKTPHPAGAAAKPNPLKQFVANLLLPDPQVGWLPFAARAAVRIVRKRKIDAVIITVPPFSSLMLAKRLRKQFPQLPILLDFRDEWLNTTLQLVSLNANPRARAVAERTEREAVEAATAVVMVTEAACNAIRARYPSQNADKFVSISNGFDGPLPGSLRQSAPPAAGMPVVLTYMGSVYGSTEPTTFVEAVLGLPQPLRDRLQIRFVGHFERAAYRETLLRLGENVRLTGFLPQAEALRMLETTSYVLLLSHDPVNVSAKFYDYLRSGKPILAAVHPEGDVRRRLEETRAGQWADSADVDAIRSMLASAIEHAAQGESPDQEAIARYHRRPLTKRYADLLRSLQVNP